MIAVKKSCAAAVPWYSKGSGGIRTQTSSVISATSASTSSFGEGLDEALEQGPLLRAEPGWVPAAAGVGSRRAWPGRA